MREIPPTVHLPFVMLRMRGVLVGLAIGFAGVVAAAFAVLAAVSTETFHLLIDTAVALLLTGSGVVVVSTARAIRSASRADR